MIKNQWYAILPSKDIQSSQITSVKRLGLNLAMFRDSQGKLACVADRCSHRGAALSLGKVKGDCIQCPFHGLEFMADGSCAQVPAIGYDSDLDLSRFNVQSFHVKEAHGIIYLWYGESEPAHDELPFFNDYIDQDYVYSELEDHWAAHYSRCIENQLDVVHLPFVHHNTIGRGNKTLINGPKVLWENETLITSANNEVDRGQKPKKGDACEIRKTFLAFKYPNIWMNHITDTIRVIIFFAPVDDENTILYIRFYDKITSSKILNAIIAFFGKYANKIIERQDRRVVITQEPKVSSYKGFEKLVPGDAPIIRYRKIRDELKNML